MSTDNSACPFFVAKGYTPQGSYKNPVLFEWSDEQFEYTHYRDFYAPVMGDFDGDGNMDYVITAGRMISQM